MKLTTKEDLEYAEKRLEQNVHEKVRLIRRIEALEIFIDKLRRDCLEVLNKEY